MNGFTSSGDVNYTSISGTELVDITNAEEVAFEQGTESKLASAEETLQNATVGSDWSVGWKTPLLMWSFYVGAILTALLHLLMFLYLNHKPAEGDNSVPQTYVTTASNLLATAYRLVLNAALTIAFTQHLWRIFRKSPLKISTVEALYTVRSNPLSFFTGQGARRAPLLLLLALLIWTIGIATSFPPGGLTVGTVEVRRYKNTTVPSFDPYFIGGGQMKDLGEVALAMFGFAGRFGSWEDIVTVENRRGSLVRLATSTMIGEQMILAQSPCGLNCSYELEFEGPMLSCTESTSNVTSNDTATVFQMYEGVWQNPFASFMADSAGNTTYTDFTGNSTYSKFTATTRRLLGYLDGIEIVESHVLECIPSSAQYSLNVTHTNSVPSIAISTGPSRTLSNTALGVGFYTCPDNCKCCFTVASNCSCRGAPQWTQANLDWFRDTSLVTLIDATMAPLAGGYLIDVSSNTSAPNFQMNVTFNGKDYNGTVTPGWMGDGPSDSSTLGSQNSSIVIDTAINQDLHDNLFNSGPPTLNFTESILNDLLKNITMSTFNTFNIWNITANTTTSTYHIVYVFSRPLNLILPYSLTLLLALLFLVLGTVSLFQNGVPAETNSFIQLLVSLTGSGTLQDHAASGCLGGWDNIPRELRDLQIQLGDLTVMGGDVSGEGAVHRAGFGVSHEVGPLMRTAKYGIA